MHDPWPHQISGVDGFWGAVDSGAKNICLHSPTGGGKTFMTTKIIGEARQRGMKVSFNVNRKSLAEQTRKSFLENGISPGMRASEYDPDFGQDVQICMTPTESIRTFGPNPSWGTHDAKLVFFDEAHADKSARAIKIMNAYRQQDPEVVFCGLTATPLDIGHMYDTLVVAGTNSELRECGAHLFCKEFCPTLPDVLKMKRKANGEYAEKDIDKKMQPAMVFGRILEHHRRLNPTLKPAIVFAPSVGHSITLAEKYLNAGIRAAHICGKHIYYGEKNSEGVPVMEDSSKIKNREELFDKVRTGEIQVLSSKYVLVEGIDLPMVYHTIMATIFGSLTMYLQAGGRGLRNHDSLEHVILQDHGANAIMHGSLNDDRVWELGLSAKKLAEQKTKDRQSGKDKEPIVCPKCGAMRLSGGTCWECGHKHSQSGLNILEEDGTLRQRTGDYIKVRKAKSDSQAIKSWFSTYFPCSKSKSPRAMTWNQMLGQFKHKNPDLIVFKTTDPKGRKRIAATDSSGVMSYLPMHPPIGNDYLWSQKVRDVPREKLVK
jgi:superfamily II DNA or RNA helicase